LEIPSPSRRGLGRGDLKMIFSIVLPLTPTLSQRERGFPLLNS